MTPSRLNSLCAVCHTRILTPWVVGEDAKPRHSDVMGCVDALKEQLEMFLAVAGAEIRDGKLIFSSHKYGQWVKKRGNAILEQRISELERILARQSHLMPCGGECLALAASEPVALTQFEDELPQDLTRKEYDEWYKTSQVVDGVRMGEEFKR